MIGFVMVGTNDLDRAIDFYDTILEIIDLKRVEKTETYGSYAPKSNSDAIEFYVTVPHNKENATVGNGTQISFYIDKKETCLLYTSDAADE